jgi:hypothetical protein
MYQKHDTLSTENGNKQTCVENGNFVNMSDVVVRDVFGICSNKIGPAAYLAVDQQISEIGPSIDPGTVTNATKYIYDMLAYFLLDGVLTSDLTPLVGIVTIQLDNIGGSLNLHSYHSAMAILIGL